ncbi:uncharacterized protein [Panulirus ornatus]|uniref:uncharacterized protein n=1 Tax=Panulirus ornatus TaxID=150431 RepID=UPI003A857654
MVDLGGRRSKPPAPNNTATTNNNVATPPRPNVYTGVSVKHLRRSYCDQARLCEPPDVAATKGGGGGGREPYITKANVARLCAAFVGPIPPLPQTPPRRNICTGVSVALVVSTAHFLLRP